MVVAERHERLFKWAAILSIIVAVFAVAASAGLTYAVVTLSKDVKVSNDLLVSKSTGLPLSTMSGDTQVSDSGALLNRQSTGPVATSAVYEDVTMAEIMQQLQASDINSQEVQAMLSEIESVTVPGTIPGSAGYSVWKVAEVSPLENGTIIVRSTAGNVASFGPDGSANITSNGASRRLLDAGLISNVRRRVGTTALSGGLQKWQDVWTAKNGDTRCSDIAPIASNGQCVPCYSAVEKGASCWPDITGAESIVCTSLGICVDSRDRLLATENGAQVAGDLICRSLFDFSTATLIPAADPPAGQKLPCFPCTDKVQQGQACWDSGVASGYTCQSDGTCELTGGNNKKKKNKN